MNLSELSVSQTYVKKMLFGSSGSGKTIGAATAPGKKLWFDFDNKIESAALFYKNNTELLKSIEVKQYGKMPIKPVPGGKSRMQSFFDDLKPIYADQNAGKKCAYDTIILDTVSTLADSILEDYRYVSQLGIKRPNQDQNSQSDYGLLATHVKQIITGLLAVDCNLIIIGHTKLEKDDVTGMMMNQIMFPGSMKDNFGIYFLETYFAKVNQKGERVWQTQADSKSPWVKTARNLPAEIPANFAEIVKAR